MKFTNKSSTKKGHTFRATSNKSDVTSIKSDITLNTSDITVNKADSPAKKTRTKVVTSSFDESLVKDDTIISHANTLKQKPFNDLLKYLDDNYHNDEGLITDSNYNILVKIYELKYGIYGEIGAKPRRNKVKLPYNVTGLRKVTLEKELLNYVDKHPGDYIFEDKLDGLAMLLVSKMVDCKRTISLYTRGHDGEGTDVSHLFYFIPFPKIDQDIVVRGEIILSKEIFEKVKGDKTLARSFINGLVMSQKHFNPDIVKQLTFFAYRIVDQQNTVTDDIKILSELGFTVPFWKKFDTLDFQTITELVTKRKEESPYEIDGGVIYQNVYKDYPTEPDDTPQHVIAFKIEEEQQITTVTYIEWNASKHKVLVPRIHYDMTKLAGANAQHVSGRNARYIMDNNVGVGSEILITIKIVPDIVEFLKPAPNGAKLPDPDIYGHYVWDDNNVNIILLDDNDQVYAKRLENFFSVLGIKGIGEKRTVQLVKGGITNISELLQATADDFLKIEGIGKKLAGELPDMILQSVTNAQPEKILAVSGFFPTIGTMFKNVFEAQPDILDHAFDDRDTLIASLQTIKGIKLKANVIADGLPLFVGWLKENKMITLNINPVSNIVTDNSKTNVTKNNTTSNNTNKNNNTTSNNTNKNNNTTSNNTTKNNSTSNTVVTSVGNKLEGQIVVLTGLTPTKDNIGQRIADQQGKIGDDVTKITSILVVKELTDKYLSSNKAKKAEKYGTKMMSLEDFEAKYLA